MFAKAFILASVAALASAATYQVTVGGLDTSGSPVLKFNPEFVNAVRGDIVEFTFQQKNHSIVQTSFGNVCHPLDGGFNGGFHPVPAGTTNFDVVRYTVEDDTKPLWFYCSQATHCGKGMIFSINCPTTGDNSLDAFRERALAFGQHEAEAASWMATATPDVYGGHTYAPVYAPTVTQTVTTGSDVWTTTYQSYPDSPGPTPDTNGPQTHVIKVGENGTLTFNPDRIQAAARDIVQFVFVTKNHTATQSSFGQPCVPLAPSDAHPSPFDSGFRPVRNDSAAADLTFEITVDTPEPIWVFCQQATHCGKGMVFSINAGTVNRTHDDFVALARTLNSTDGNGGSGGNGNTNNTGAAAASTTIVGGLAGLALAGAASIFALLL